jgi:hypothetical protein
VPLTLAHPAAVLPLRRLGLPLSSLVAGSMVLDVPLYLGSRRGYEIAHSLPGILTVDVVGTLAVLWLWFTALRDPMADLSPAAIRDRVPVRARLARRQWLLAPLGAVVGALTHVVWDSFTHVDQWGYEHVGWLRSDHLGIAGLRWSQYVSAVGGLLVVAVFTATHLRTLAVRPGRPPRLLPAATLPTVVIAAAAVGAVAALGHATVGVHAMAFHGAVSSIIVLAAGLVLVCAAWHVAAGRLSRRP